MSDPDSARRNQRRQYVINKRLQIHWVAWTFLVVFVALAGAAVAVGFSFIASPDVESGGWRFISLKSALALWAFLAVLAWVSLRMTHTIAGPMHRFRGVAKSVAAGDYDLPAIRLRKRDEFKELADDLDQVLVSLRTRRDKTREATETVLANLDKLARVLAEEKGRAQESQLTECLARAREACAELTELSK